MAQLDNSSEGANLVDSTDSASTPPSRKLSALLLAFLIFYEVSGGPFGTEESVQSGGSFLAILGFLFFPLVWSIPEALITAEMATAYPDNGGYVIWTSAAFGPFWGFLQGWWKWTSGVINNATYPILCLDYLKVIFPLVGEGLPRTLGIFIITVVLTFLNYRGLTIVGWSAVILGVFCLLPFFVMAGISIPILEPARWLSVNLSDVSWRQYLNTLFWNLNFWDNASTLAGEVEEPQKAFPRALLVAGVLVGSCYLIAILAGTGAVEVVRSDWEDGYFAVLAGQLGGQWLQWWMEVAATLSCVGLFIAQMSSSSFQVLGMAELGILPSLFSFRSAYSTPTIGILLSAFGTLLLSFFSFQQIIEAANALYSCGMLLEIAAFIWLRVKEPNHPRPFQVPLGISGVILLCLPPIALLIFVMTLLRGTVILICCVGTVVGLLLYVCLVYSNKKKWMKFLENHSVDVHPVAENSVHNFVNEESSPLLQE